MRKAMMVFVVLGICWIARADYAQSENSYQLKWNLRKGGTLLYETTADLQSSMSAAGESGTITQKLISKHKYEVLDVDSEGTALIRQTLVSLKVVITDSTESISVESFLDENGQCHSDGDESLRELFADVVGTAHEFRMSNKAKVLPLEQKGQGTLEDQLINRFELDRGETGSAEAMQAEAVLPTLVILPDEKVKVGQSWSDCFTTELGPLGSLVSTSCCTLKRIVGTKAGRGCAVVGIANDIKLESSCPSVMLKNAESTGELYFDIDRGRLERSTSETRMVVVIPGSPTVTQEQVVKTNVALLEEK